MSEYKPRQLHFGSNGELLLNGVVEEFDPNTGRIHNAALFFMDTNTGSNYGIELYTVASGTPLDPYEDYVPGSVPVDSVGPTILMQILGLGTQELKGIARRMDVDDDLSETV